MSKVNFMSKWIILSFLAIALQGCGEPDRIEGVVQDIFGQPISGVNIGIENTTFSATTDASGKYSIDYAPGQLRLEYSRKGYTTEDLALNIQQKVRYPVKTIKLHPVPDQEGIYYIDRAKKELKKIKTTTHVSDFESRPRQYFGSPSYTGYFVTPKHDQDIIYSGRAEFIVKLPYHVQLSTVGKPTRQRKDNPNYPNAKEKSLDMVYEIVYPGLEVSSRLHYDGLVKGEMEYVGKEKIKVISMDLKEGKYAWLRMTDRKLRGGGYQIQEDSEAYLMTVVDEKRYKKSQEAIALFDKADNKLQFVVDRLRPNGLDDKELSSIESEIENEIKSEYLSLSENRDKNYIYRYIDAGDYEKAIRIIQDKKGIGSIGEWIFGSEKGKKKLEMARMLAGSADAISSKIDDDLGKARMYLSISNMLSNYYQTRKEADKFAELASKAIGGFDKAREIANRITDPGKRDAILSEMAIQYAKRELFSQALDLVKDINDRNKLIKAYIGIAEEYAKFGVLDPQKWKKAKNLLAKVKNMANDGSNLSLEVIEDIAVVYAINNTRMAINMLVSEAKKRGNPWIMIEAANKLLSKGYMEEAENIFFEVVAYAKGVKSDIERDMILESAAINLSYVGNLNTAVEAALSCVGSMGPDEPVEDIESYEGYHIKKADYVLSRIVKELSKSEMAKEVQKTLYETEWKDKANEVASKIENSVYLSEALYRVSIGLSKENRFVDALSEVLNIPDSTYKYKALSIISFKYAKENRTITSEETNLLRKILLSSLLDAVH